MGSDRGAGVLRGDGAHRRSTGRDSTILVSAVDAATWDRLTLAARVAPPSDPATGHALVLEAIRAGATVTAAVAGALVVGLAIAGPPDERQRRELVALGVAPAFRRRGLAGALLGACFAARGPGETEATAEVTVAERDPIEPLARDLRAAIARRLLERAGFEIGPADPAVRTADPGSFRAVRSSG